MIELVDTHTHLNDAKFAGEEQAAIERANLAGVTKIINMGDTMASSTKAVNLARQYDGVFAGVGIHPEEAYEMTQQDDDVLAAFATEPKVVAIGEIGLDYYWEKDEAISGVMHCFSGSMEMAQELLKMGWYIGVDGPLTFKNAAKLPAIVKSFPLERILLETDAPYMAPVPMRGKRNEPAFIRYIGEKVAEIKGITLSEVAKQTSENAMELYGV